MTGYVIPNEKNALYALIDGAIWTQRTIEVTLEDENFLESADQEDIDFLKEALRMIHEGEVGKISLT